MSYSIGQFVDELMAMLNDDDAQVLPDDVLMLNVAGRWTGIKGIVVEKPGLVLIESKD